MDRPKTIHDFYGFPDELFSVQYPAPGDVGLAEEVAEIAKPTWVGFDHDSWGLDHGTWSVLVHAFPDADIPVVQLSINAQETFEYHLELGARLAPLRNQGVLVIGSGNVVHNLRGVDWSQPEGGFDWAHRFDDAARRCMTSAPQDLAALRSHADFDAAVPTPDHFIPLLYLAGLGQLRRLHGGGAGRRLHVRLAVHDQLHDRLELPESIREPLRPALPDRDLIPPDDTNT